MLIIDNVRFGFATNSSSTHSMVFLNPEDTVTDDREYATTWEFGWEEFTLASPETKTAYLATILAMAIDECDLPDQIRHILFEEIVGLQPEDEMERGTRYYIDHQSALCLPLEFGGNTPDIKFAKDLRDFVLAPRLVILGGNDNSEAAHPLRTGNDNFNVSYALEDGRSVDWTCRWDSANQYWALFNHKYGTKLRLRLVPDQRPEELTPPTRSEVPELVDLKITDRCSRNCPHCYQNSGPAGDHAEPTQWYHLPQAFREAKVFEVALGGGEPTIHPDFPKMVRDFHRAGVTVNFSTGSMEWMHNAEIVGAVIEHCGGFAFSPNFADGDVQEQLKKFHGLVNSTGMGSVDHWNARTFRNVNIHCVLGGPGLNNDTGYRRPLEWALRTCQELGFVPTLLGFKYTGRGENFSTDPEVPRTGGQRADSWWIDDVLQSGLDRVNIDTCLAAAFEHELAQHTDRRLFHTREGAYSCYMDAVTQRMGPSSFCDPSQMIQGLPGDGVEMRQLYAQIQEGL